jgi:hypothetical protein
MEAHSPHSSLVNLLVQFQVSILSLCRYIREGLAGTQGRFGQI